MSSSVCRNSYGTSAKPASPFFGTRSTSPVALSLMMSGLFDSRTRSAWRRSTARTRRVANHAGVVSALQRAASDAAAALDGDARRIVSALPVRSWLPNMKNMSADIAAWRGHRSHHSPPPDGRPNPLLPPAEGGSAGGNEARVAREIMEGMEGRLAVHLTSIDDRITRRVQAERLRRERLRERAAQHQQHAHGSAAPGHPLVA